VRALAHSFPRVGSLPSRLLLERLLPVLDMIRDDPRSLISREIPSNGLDEITFRVYTVC
jgi:hypothetical protein